MSFIIGGEELSDDTEWCVSASAFRFLHTVFENHFIGSEDFLIPHCGHFMIPSADGKSVIVSGCNIGIDFNVIHEDNRIKVQTGDRREYSLSFDEYRKAVLDYADRITAFYASNPPRKTENAFDKEGFRAFVSEYNALYNKAKGLFERLSKNNARHRFYEFQKQITELGYSTFDLT